MTNNYGNPVKPNEQELVKDEVERDEAEVLAGEVLETVTGGMGILDVLAHRGYVADALNTVPPSEGIKPVPGTDFPRPTKKIHNRHANSLPFGLTSPKKTIVVRRPGSENSAFKPYIPDSNA